MVHVIFYNTKAMRNVINKTITPVLTTTAELYDNTNFLNPELKLAWNNTYISSANFFYIQEFNRFYFIDDVIAEPGGAARIKGSVDVLYTYKGSISNDQIVITRAYNSKPYESSPNNTGPTYVKDSKLPIKPEREIKVYTFNPDTNPFTLDKDSQGYYYVLNVIGKEPT